MLYCTIDDRDGPPGEGRQHQFQSPDPEIPEPAARQPANPCAAASLAAALLVGRRLVPIPLRELLPRLKVLRGSCSRIGRGRSRHGLSGKARGPDTAAPRSRAPLARLGKPVPVNIRYGLDARVSARCVAFGSAGFSSQVGGLGDS